MRHEALIALGGNQGHVVAAFAAVLTALPNLCGPLTAVSALYLTEPQQRPDDSTPMAPYHNAVCAIMTVLAPRILLHTLQALERAHGRVPAPRWSARPLDLDLLAYGDTCCTDAELTLPHPRLAERAFVLLPLCDVAPNLTIAGLGKTPRQLLTQLPDFSCSILGRDPHWRDP